MIHVTRYGVMKDISSMKHYNEPTEHTHTHTHTHLTSSARIYPYVNDDNCDKNKKNFLDCIRTAGQLQGVSSQTSVIVLQTAGSWTHPSGQAAEVQLACSR